MNKYYFFMTTLTRDQLAYKTTPTRDHLAYDHPTRDHLANKDHSYKKPPGL